MSRRRADADVHGVCVIDKPVGWTSHDVVAKLRGVLGTRKVGHSGTLDPPASGVLVLGVGRATRLLRFVTELEKTYTGEIVLGIETDTLDDAGEVMVRHEMSPVDLAAARAAARSLTGEIEQVPPMVSAVKVGGRRLHELAREGRQVERAARPVRVHEFSLTATDDPSVLRCHVRCSAGTYVRTLAADLGSGLGGGAHLRNLRRLAVGPFTTEQATTIDDAVVLAPATVFAGRPSVTVTGDDATAVGHGKVLDAGRLGVDGPGPWAVLAGDGALLAVYQRHRGDTVKPAVVLVG